jgi:hypothetical protein
MVMSPFSNTKSALPSLIKLLTISRVGTLILTMVMSANYGMRSVHLSSTTANLDEIAAPNGNLRRRSGVWCYQVESGSTQAIAQVDQRPGWQRGDRPRLLTCDQSVADWIRVAET